VLNFRQAGVTLIESMVALLVVSIGLLGIAALQITAMKQNALALNHSQAVWIGYSMADRIRANVSQFSNYAGIDTDTGYSQDCMGAACNNTQMVTADAADWSTHVQNLPSGRGVITGDASRLAVSVMWDDEGAGATGTNCGNDPQVDLTCYTVTLVR
jgi:type IV pilus assembly protein PilV